MKGIMKFCYFNNPKKSMFTFLFLYKLLSRYHQNDDFIKIDKVIVYIIKDYKLRELLFICNPFHGTNPFTVL